jgi:hypothetical protein
MADRGQMKSKKRILVVSQQPQNGASVQNISIRRGRYPYLHGVPRRSEVQ